MRKKKALTPQVCKDNPLNSIFEKSTSKKMSAMKYIPRLAGKNPNAARLLEIHREMGSPSPSTENVLNQSASKSKSVRKKMAEVYVECSELGNPKISENNLFDA